MHDRDRERERKTNWYSSNFYRSVSWQSIHNAFNAWNEKFFCYFQIDSDKLFTIKTKKKKFPPVCCMHKTKMMTKNQTRNRTETSLYKSRTKRNKGKPLYRNGNESEWIQHHEQYNNKNNNNNNASNCILLNWDAHIYVF